MSAYQAPVKDIMYTLRYMVGIADLQATPAYQELSDDLLTAIFSEGGKLVADIVAPHNLQADVEGVSFNAGVVNYPKAYVKAWQAFVAGGWPGLTVPTQYGGQGMSQLVFGPIQEMICAGSLSFAQGPGLTAGAVEAIEAHASEALKRLYLPKIASGEWTGTMNLTEPQAGSDVGALRTRALQQADGSYNITGQKIFISCGEQDFSDNIVHLVLARVEGAPQGSKGISLFIVPKIIPNADGSLGHKNDLRCTGIEHKLGLHGSSVCSMSYGDNGGASGWLVGEENKGLACMFTMMNRVRLHVGLQGVGIAERSYQMALSYARERVQGVPIGASDATPATIIHHADVRRMLLTMRAKIAGARALCLFNAKAIDLSLGLNEGDERQNYWEGLADLLTPLSKSYATDIGVEVSSEAVQVFGGMGFIEETGIAQLYRDARITPIYEGTNAIQAWDLSNRKLKMAEGRHWQGLLADINSFAASLEGELKASAEQLLMAAAACQDVAQWFLQRHSEQPRDVAAGSVLFQRLMAKTVCAWLLLRGAHGAVQRISAGDSDSAYLASKVNLAKFYAERLLPIATGLAAAAKNGDQLLFADDEELLVSL